MRERKFVDQNIEKWAQIEQNLKHKSKDVEVLRKDLVQVTDDLSFARTFYRSRSVRVYLNGLTKSVYDQLYSTRRPVWPSIRMFFTSDVPKIIYHSRKELLLSFIFLIASIAIGIFSAHKDPEFSSSILGKDYLEMTVNNIENGDPFGVYKQENQFEMFYSIARNNLEVGLKVFLFGLLASYGALAIMLSNGVALGVFMYFFYSRNLASEFNFTVWMHGGIEILTLIIETLAGILLGRGLIYPGTLSRSKAFGIWGRRAAMLYLSTIPFILFAAFIESFLTRYTEMPNALRLILILSSVGLMIFYFAWYPFRQFKNSSDTDFGLPDLKPETPFFFNPKQIDSSKQIFLQSIKLLGMDIQKTLLFCLLITVCFLICSVAYDGFDYVLKFQTIDLDFEKLLGQLGALNFNQLLTLIGNLNWVFNGPQNWFYYFLQSSWMAALTLFVLHHISKHLKAISSVNFKVVAMTFFFSFFFNLVFLQDSILIKIVALLATPLAWWSVVDQINHNTSISLKEKISLLLGKGLGRSVTLILVFFASLFIGLLLVASPLSYFALTFIDLNFDYGIETKVLIAKFMLSISLFLMVSFLWVFYSIQWVILTFTLNEMAGAQGILEGIESMGTTRKAYGIEME